MAVTRVTKAGGWLLVAGGEVAIVTVGYVGMSELRDGEMARWRWR